MRCVRSSAVAIDVRCSKASAFGLGHLLPSGVVACNVYCDFCSRKPIATAVQYVAALRYTVRPLLLLPPCEFFRSLYRTPHVIFSSNFRKNDLVLSAEPFCIRSGLKSGSVQTEKKAT